MAKNYYAVEIETGTSVTSAAIGCVSGTMRFITDRPGYTGAPTYPKWEDDSDNVHVWYENFLTLSGMSNPNRQVDLSGTGGYGTLSGFNFQLDASFVAGTGTPIWKAIKTAGIELSNKTVKVYAVIANKFYQIWTGIISNCPISETDYKFTCKSNFKAIHKDIPPVAVTESNYPLAPDDSQGKSLPVCVGDIRYANLLPVTGDPEWYALVNVDEINYKTAMASAYTEDSTGAFISLVTTGKTFTLNELTGTYLFVTSGTGADTETGIQIVSNTATVAGVTIIYLTKNLVGWSTNYNYTNATSQTGTWIFKIAKLTLTGALSNRPVSTAIYNGVRPILYNFNSKGLYEDVRYLYLSQSFASTPSTVNFDSSNILIGGDIKYLFPIKTSIDYLMRYALFGKSTSIPNYAGDESEMIDLDRSTLTTIRAVCTSFGYAYGQFIFNLSLDEQNLEAITSLWLCHDLKYELSGGGEITGGVGVSCILNFYDEYGRLNAGYAQSYFFSAMTQTPNLNMIPNDYYRGALSGNGANSESSHFTVSLTGSGIPHTALLLPSTVMNKIKDNTFLKKINIVLTFYNITQKAEDTSMDFSIREVGLFALRNIDVAGNKIFVKTGGEKLADTSTANTVYKAFRLLLEQYDGISAANIDYGNLASKRNLWYLGRQLTERKNSMEYIKELAEQSFVIVWQNRIGKIALSAWRERSDAALVHDEDVIIRNSITDWKLTSVDDIYNNFTLKYSPSPGDDTFLSQLQLKDCDSAGGSATSQFPALWVVCRACYLLYKVVKEFAIELPWYENRSNMGLSSGCGTDGAEYKFLDLAVYWLTRQKRSVTYRLPLTAANAVIDLCAPINFRDTIFTDGATDTSYVRGSIESLEYDLSKDQIVVGALLDPNDTIDADYGDIVETGDAPDLIVESGSQTNTYTEDG